MKDIRTKNRLLVALVLSSVMLLFATGNLVLCFVKNISKTSAILIFSGVAALFIINLLTYISYNKKKGKDENGK